MVSRFPNLNGKIFDEDGNLCNYFDIYVNLENAYPEEVAKTVQDGDEIHLVMMISGG